MTSRYCQVRDPSFLRFGRKGSVAFLVLGCLAIVGWQSLIIADAEGLDRTYGRAQGRGLYPERIQKYFYFVYYTGKFPISTHYTVSHLRWNQDAAWRALEGPAWDPFFKLKRARSGDQTRRSPRLIMEDYAVLRTGDLGKIFLLYPDAWIRGTPKRATLLWFNRLLGVGSLLAVFVSFSLLQHRLLGSLLVLLLGSHPLEIYELYARNNIFGYPIAIASLMLALNAPLLLTRSRHRLLYLLPVVSGLLLASFREVRLEPFLIVLSVGATCLFAPGGWRRRVALFGLLAVTTTATHLYWRNHWAAKFDEAYEIVERQNGVTFDGEWNLYHALWHSIWCGLGDFGQDKGYMYKDLMAYRYGIPRVNLRYGTDYELGGFLLKNYHTAAQKHRIKPETVDEYGIVLRDKVLGDIVDDPLWYAGVIAKRVQLTFSEPTPVRLGFATRYIDIPFSAWLLLPVLAWLAYMRRWKQVKLLAFYLPVSLTTVAVYAGRSMSYNSAFHLVLFAVLACWAVHTAAAAARGVPWDRTPEELGP